MPRPRNYGLVSALLLLSAYSAAQDKPVEIRGSLPKAVSASVPFYPRLAPAARIQGVVRLRLSTDGKRVSTIDAETGPPMLVRAAKENVKTWLFEPHAPTSFETKFHYRLLNYKCDSECKCESEEKESVVLQLPANVEVSAVIPMICDSAGKIGRKQ